MFLYIIQVQQNKDNSFPLKIAFVLANSIDPDEMLYCAAFHLGLHCQQL